MVAAILLFVGSGGRILPSAAASLFGNGAAPDNIAATALILNIALIIFGWRRYRELTAEIEVHKTAEQQAKALALTDSLTGCLNRRAIGDIIQNMIEASASSGKTVALIMLDLDNFKTINDIQGHEAGDRVLQEVARRLSGVLGPNARIARLGGDEFACAIPFDPQFPETVRRFVEDIIERIAEPIQASNEPDEHNATVSASIGITRADSCDNNYDLLMRRADMAMYYSKKQGRNRYNWFERRMENEVRLRNKIEAGMRVGIASGEFIPYYEQQIDLATGELIGFEVLARWQSDALGLVSPDVFIPIAEDNGLINDLSMCVVRQAMIDARNWSPHLTISVNISPVQLRDPWLAQKIVKLLVESGFPANRLEVEISEACLFENIGLAQSIIGSLKNQGVRIALDDFGMGYSSLAHLRALPFDRIKIDRSFVTNMAENSDNEEIVRSITILGETMGLPITAEGIESDLDRDRLVALGCVKGQGYHFGKPEPIDSTRRMLAERNLLSTGPVGADETTQTEPADDDKATLSVGKSASGKP